MAFARSAVIDKVSYPVAIGYSSFATITGFELKTIPGLREGAGSLKFSSSNYTVNDTVGAATISVVRTGGNTLPVSVDYSTKDGTAREAPITRQRRGC